MRSIASVMYYLTMGAVTLAVTACGPKYPNCEKDDDCREAEFCVNNQCQQCRDNSDCETDQKCASGACVAMGYCDSPDDCAEGQVCRDNLCAPCVEDSECLGGMMCLAGVCKEPECATDAECPAGLSCVEHQCQTTETSSVSSAEENNQQCSIDSIYFDFDSSLIKPQQRQTLQQTYQCLQDEDGRIVVEGHADPRGTTEYNMALGERRSRSVKKYLTRNGADEDRFRVRSKGEEEASGYNPKTWAKDRRVDFQ